LIHPEISTPHLDLAVGRYGPRVRLSFRHGGDIELHPTSLRIFNIFEDLVSHINPITPLLAAQEIDSLYPSQTSPTPAPPSDQGSKLSPEDFLLNLWEIFLHIVEQIPASHPCRRN
jgi:hypothetical protein